MTKTITRDCLAKGGEGRPRRVLLVEINEDGTVGGSHQCLYDLALRLDRARYEPVALFYQRNRFVDPLREAGIAVHVWNAERVLERARPIQRSLLRKVATARKAPAAVLRRLRFLQRERIDLVHLNNTPCIGFDDWLPAARLARLPILSHARGPYSAPSAAASRWLIRRFDAVVAISRYVAESFERSGISRHRIRLVHDGIDLARWTPRPAAEGRRIRAEAGVPDDALLLVLVGLLRSWKGQDVALSALKALDPELRKNVRLWLVGEAPHDEAAYAERLQRFVTEHGLGDTVRFLGFRAEIPQIMGAADVVLHASTLPEPFGLVVLEGLALGKAVIASRGGGPAEILRPGDGLLFGAGQPLELASLLADLASSPETRKRLGERGLERVRDFDVQRTAERMVRVWDDCVASRRSTATSRDASN